MAKDTYTRNKKENDVEVNKDFKEIEKVVEEAEEKVEKVIVLKPKQLAESFIDKKIQTITNSRMPEYQKAEYISALKKDDKKIDGISLSVYFKIKDLSKTVSEGMRYYPKAVGISLATLEQWNEIFADY